MQNNYMLKNLGLLFLISVLFCSCLEKEKEIKYSFTQDTIVIAKICKSKGFMKIKAEFIFMPKNIIAILYSFIKNKTDILNFIPF